MTSLVRESASPTETRSRSISHAAIRPVLEDDQAVEMLRGVQ